MSDTYLTYQSILFGIVVWVGDVALFLAAMDASDLGTFPRSGSFAYGKNITMSGNVGMPS
jgi:hypothetical protein